MTAQLFVMAIWCGFCPRLAQSLYAEAWVSSKAIAIGRTDDNRDALLTVFPIGDQFEAVCANRGCGV